MKTTSIRSNEINRDWFIVDAEGHTLGRLASEIAQILRGKKKPFFTPHMDMGDFVVVVNADKIKVTGNKMSQKQYYRHTGYPGGIKSTVLSDLMESKPTEAVEKAVKGRLPRTKLGRSR